MVSLSRIIGFLILGASWSSIPLTGCAQQTASDVQAQSPNAASSPSPAASPSPTTTTAPSPDVVYVPTPEAVVTTMMQLANVKPGDIVYDLGSGDGRIVITAIQKYGAKKGIGIEIDPERIKEAQANAANAGVSDRVTFQQQDLFKTDFREATVVALYLLPELNVKLRPQLFKQLKPGTRIVSHDFDMGDWKPEKTVKVKGPSREHTVFFWRIPEKIPENLQ
jgi:predicted O-methyltransferase YrrM